MKNSIITNELRLVKFIRCFLKFTDIAFVSKSLGALLLSAIVGLSGCTTMPAEDPALKESKNGFLENRVKELSAINSWNLNGRFSLVTDDEAWSGKLYWAQRSNHEYFIQFSAPSGQGAMQLVGNGELVELQLANGDSFQAADADALMRQETDWDLPINSLWYWIRGLPDPGLSKKTEFDSKNMLEKLEQDGWVVNYNKYQPVDGYSFPRKITIVNDTMKLRLILTKWVIE